MSQLAAPNETVKLLAELIANACVNDGSPDSGQEVRNADVLGAVLEGPGLEIERYEPHPGRVSLVARIEGTDRSAPSLCLMGHTDVVPVDPKGWTHDPFGGELIAGEIWGRGAVDMLNLTASMAVAVRRLVDEGFRPRGDLVYFAVADEEAGSTYGARWVADHRPEAITCDYALTEFGGIGSTAEGRRTVGVSVAEKGVAWRRLRVHGVPGHGSMPYGADNALLTAAAVMARIAAYQPGAHVHELWAEHMKAMGLPDATRAALSDPERIDEALAELHPAQAAHVHAATHTTFSCNALYGPMKVNVIPGVIDLDVDIRTVPGDDAEAVQAHLDQALGDLAKQVEVTPLMNDQASSSPTGTPLWHALERSVARQFPGGRLGPQLMTGFTDARVLRELGTTVYGAGLFSDAVSLGELGRRFHGHDERVDIESLARTTELWYDLVRDLLG